MIPPSANTFVLNVGTSTVLMTGEHYSLANSRAVKGPMAKALMTKGLHYKDNSPG